MKNMKLALIAAVVGAISLAPTQLLPSYAAIIGSAVSPSLSVSSGDFGAVAGASSAATTASAFAVTSMTPTCSASYGVSATAINSSTIILDVTPTANLVVGMIILTTTGIAAGTKVTAINTTTKVITITPNTTAAINKSAILTFSGCYQAYFSVNNIRSIALSSFQISQTVNTTAPDSITLQSCSLTWTDEATGACSGTITNIVVTNSGTSAFTTVTGALAASTGTVRLRALSNTIGRTSTVSINIARVNLRAAIITNS